MLSWVTSYSYTSSKSQYYYLHCADGETEAWGNAFTRQVDQRAKRTYSLSVMHKPPHLLYTILISATSPCISSPRRKPGWSTPAAELSEPFQRDTARPQLYGASAWSSRRKPHNYPKSSCKSLSIVTDCSRIDLPLPRPAPTWPNHTVSETYWFPPSRDVNSTETHTKSCVNHQANPAQSPGCCGPGRSVAGVHLPELLRFTAPGWVDMPQRAKPPSHTDRAFKVFYQKALAWGCP